MSNDTNLYSEKNMEKVRQNLAAGAGRNFSADTGVARHVDPKNLISLPEIMSVEEAAQQLTETAANLAEEGNFRKIFKYRYEDGAYATSQVMKLAFGTLGRGKPIHTMFGTQLPSDIEISIGIDAEGHEIKSKVFDRGTQVEFRPVEGTIAFTGTTDPELGSVFALQITCPKKYEAVVEGFFNLVEHQLQTSSIYKGKSWRNVNNPKFISLRHNDTIVYNDDTFIKLQTGVLGVLENRRLCQTLGIPTAPKTLLYGAFGTGKTEFGLLTAEVANKNDVTFIMHDGSRDGIEGLKQALRAARMYQPSVLFIEDMDQYMKEGSIAHSELTNLFDGPDTKGHDVMIMMTTNFEENFSASMIRPGRVDNLIHVTNLDRKAQETMMNRVLGGRLADDVDFDQVYQAMEGYEPAFVRSTFTEAKKHAAFRTNSSNFELTTEDLVAAAISRRDQWEMHHRLNEKKTDGPALQTALEQLVAGQVRQETLRTVRTEVANFRLDLNDGEIMYQGDTEPINA